VVSPTAGTVAAAITIKDFAYGEPLTVAPGAMISVTNMDTAEHTVTADAGSASSLAGAIVVPQSCHSGRRNGGSHGHCR